MSQSWTIVCDTAELAVECARRAPEAGLEVEPRVSQSPVADAAAAHANVAVASSQPLAPADLVRLAGGDRSDGPLPLALVGLDPAAVRPTALARDLGLAAVVEVRPLMAVLALRQARVERPWSASTRALWPVDRARLAGPVTSGSGRPSAQWVSLETGLLGLAVGEGTPVPIGEPRDVREALQALREADGARRPPMPAVEGAEPQAVLDVIFGPRRDLSDPASKAALSPYDLPMPVEELCTSASRAASEASRIGFPVRIALASPDLRVGDHPDLAVDGVDNAARVRDVFRQLTALGRQRLPRARLLGVTVSATTPAHALLRVRVSPLPDGLALCELGFADPHGLASGDHVQTALPAPPARLELALSRLSGHPLLLEGSAADRRRTVTALGDVLLRLAAFTHDWREQVESVTLDPLALLVGGGIEVREACVAVSDAFERTLAAR